MRKCHRPGLAQLVLELTRPTPIPSPRIEHKGLIEALAAVLLEALEVDTVRTTGGRDERQDHA